MPYSVRWRGQRRVLQQYFSPQAIEMYQPIQQQQVHISRQDLLSAPDHFVKSLRKYEYGFPITLAKYTYRAPLDLLRRYPWKAADGESTLVYDVELLEKFKISAHAIADMGDSGGPIIDLIPLCKCSRLA